MTTEVLMSYTNANLDRGSVVVLQDEEFIVAQFYDNGTLVRGTRYDLNEEVQAHEDAYAWCLPTRH